MLKNFVLIVLFFIIVGYAYITVSERQQQRLIRERRPKVQQMFNREEFRRSLYQIREARERAQDPAQQTLKAPNDENAVRSRPDEPLRNDMNYLEHLKTEPSTPAQPIENLYDPRRITRAIQTVPIQRNTEETQEQYQQQYQQQYQEQYQQQQEQQQYQYPQGYQYPNQGQYQTQPSTQDQTQGQGQQAIDPQTQQSPNPQQQPTYQPPQQEGGTPLPSRYPQLIGN